MLAKVSTILQKLAYRENLTVEEAHQALTVIGGEEAITDPTNSDGLYFLALTFGLMAKGPTADELYGFVTSISDQSINFPSEIDPDEIIDVSGTGGDKIKTFNIGSTASFIIAAAGIHVAKQSTRAYTGFTGSADIYKELGVDPFTLDSNKLLECLKETKLAAFYTPAYSGGFKNRIDFLMKLKKIGLSYPTPWHLVSWVYSPFKMNARIYGVFDKRFVLVIAELFKKLGYQKVMVVHGVDGLDEISNIGETAIAELRDGVIEERLIKPEDFNINRAAASQIKTLTDEELALLNNPGVDEETQNEIRERGRLNNIKSFFEVLYGKETGAKRDIVLMNAGAAIYLCGKAETMADGIAVAASLIDEGKAKEKLLEFASFADSKEKINEWEKKIGL